jgi:hypothetical protein
MRALGVVPVDPLSNQAPSFSEVGKVVLPDALFLETAKETLDETILLGRVLGVMNS